MNKKMYQKIVCDMYICMVCCDNELEKRLYELILIELQDVYMYSMLLNE
jgi:hypothetical protein